MEPFTYKDYLYYKNKKVKSIEDMLSISKEFYNKIFEVFEESYSKEKMAVGTLQEEEKKEILKMVVYKIFAKDIGREKIEGIMEKLEKRENKEMVIEEVLKNQENENLKNVLLRVEGKD